MKRIALSSVLFAVVACSSTTTSLGGNNTDDAGSPDGSGTGKGNGAAENGSDASVETSLDASVETSTGGVNTPCSRAAGQPLSAATCPSGLYCKFDEATCSGAGKCMPPPPPGCTELQCDCDGVPRCPAGNEAPAGLCSFQCGTETCDAKIQYCSHSPPGWGGDGGEVVKCFTYPAACSLNHTCACLKSSGLAVTACTEKDGRVDANIGLQ